MKRALVAAAGLIALLAIARRGRPSRPLPVVARAKRNRNRILRAIRESKTGLSAPPEVHDKERSMARSRLWHSVVAAKHALNKIDPQDARSVARHCKRAQRIIGLAHEYAGRGTAHKAFRTDPYLTRREKTNVTEIDYEDVKIEKPLRESLADTEAYFREFCVIGEALPPEKVREANAIMRAEVIAKADSLKKELDRIMGRRGHLRLVMDGEDA
jgi:hypothetical protein